MSIDWCQSIDVDTYIKVDKSTRICIDADILMYQNTIDADLDQRLSVSMPVYIDVNTYWGR